MGKLFLCCKKVPGLVEKMEDNIEIKKGFRSASMNCFLNVLKCENSFNVNGLCALCSTKTCVLLKKAANAFLKTLEEPPAGCVIILLTNSYESIIDTIKSRCLKLAFTPFSLSALMEIAKKLNLNMSEHEIKEHHGLSGAIEGELFSKETINLRDVAFEGFKGLIMGYAQAVSWKDRHQMKQWLQLSLTFIRDMVFIRIGAEEKMLINVSLAQELKGLSKKASVENMLDCYNKLMDISKNFVFNPNKAIVLNYVRSLMLKTF